MNQKALASRMIRRNLMVAAVLGAVVVVGAGGWAATVPLSGAVIATGTVVVDSYVKRVQHLTGGVVADVLVRNGSRVKAGDVLVRLDRTQTEANLAIIRRHLDELDAREARLTAERDRMPQPDFARAFGNLIDRPDIAGVVAGEMTLFRARASSRDGKRAQLRERSAQLLEEIDGLQAQLDGKDREIEIIGSELTAVRHLRARGLTEQTRVNGLERDAARLTSERGALISSIAQARGRIAETNLQALQIDEDLQQEVAKELREISATTGELIERRTAAEDLLSRVEIRAPQSGFVHELTVHARDAVITPGETVMTIVPDQDGLEVEARIAPQDIDQIEPGQPVSLRFSAFNQQTTPQVEGRLDRIGADLTHEEKTGLSYYSVRVEIADAAAVIEGHRLVPGMPVEVFIRTRERTMLSYLAKPIEDQMQRSLREP